MVTEGKYLEITANIGEAELYVKSKETLIKLSMTNMRPRAARDLRDLRYAI